MQLDDLRPGWQSELAFLQVGMQCVARDDCVVFRTPSNPTFYWGNYLLLAAPPGNDDLSHWLRRFDEEIGRHQSDSRHVALGVNTVYAGQRLPAWEAAGFELVVNAVLQMDDAAQRVAPPPPKAQAVKVRPVDWTADLPALLDLQCLETHGFEPAGYRRYRAKQLERYAALQRLGLAEWFGVWCDGVLAADCGLLRNAAQPGAPARFQRVVVHPAWRRRGLAGTLVDAVTRHAFERWQVTRVLMIADPEDVAIGIYCRQGYRVLEREWLLQCRAPADRVT
jgi:ribosomal protein S18 acetylase RimI-like enzyme